MTVLSSIPLFPTVGYIIEKDLIYVCSFQETQQFAFCHFLINLDHLVWHWSTNNDKKMYFAGTASFFISVTRQNSTSCRKRLLGLK